MFGNQKSKMSPGDYFRDESVPMPLPRFAQNPPPSFNQEVPKLTVPDLSLLVTSPHTSSYVNNSYGPPESTPSCNGQTRRTAILRRSPTRFPDTPSEVGAGSPYYQNHRMPNRSGQQLLSGQRQPTPNTPNSKRSPSERSTSSSSSSPSQSLKDNALIQQLIELVKGQSLAIEKMQEQIEVLVKSKDACNNSHTSSRSSTPSSTPAPIGNIKVLAEKEVQVNLPVPDTRRPSPEIKSNKIQMVNFACQTEIERKVEIERSGAGTSVENTSQQDVSRFLRDTSLRLPQIEENTIYSADTSGIRHIDMPEYDDEEDNDSDCGRGSGSPHIGPSISAYASSDEENEFDEREQIVQPAQPFRRNVLDNVNHYLDTDGNGNPPVPNHMRRKDQRSPREVEVESPADRRVTPPQRHPCPAPRQTLQKQRPPPHPQSRSTDATLYGLSSKHLSFSTKQYLERYGLVHPGGNGNPAPPPKLFIGHDALNGNGSRNTSPSSDRILDITALKNQPKLA